MKLQAEISGSDALAKALKKLGPAAVQIFGEGLERAVIRIQEVAVKSMREVSQGRAYPRGGGKMHVASKPGDPPNIDTGWLAKNVTWEIDKKALEARVGTNVEYGQNLETGTMEIAPRPWLGPALRKVRPEIVKFFRLKKVG